MAERAAQESLAAHLHGLMDLGMEKTGKASGARPPRPPGGTTPRGQPGSRPSLRIRRPLLEAAPQTPSRRSQRGEGRPSGEAASASLVGGF